MEIAKCSIPGLLILKPKVFGDDRGYFFESFRRNIFEEAVGAVQFVQENESRSQRGVFRGLHFQKPPHAQAKLVRCVEGRILDVVVDLRKSSPSFGKYEAVELSEENKWSFFVPVGFAHGFLSLADQSIVQYKTSDYYSPQDESGLSIDFIQKTWPIPRGEWLTTEKDAHWPGIEEAYHFN